MTTATPPLTELAETGADIDVLRQRVQFMAHLANAGHGRRARHHAGHIRSLALPMPRGKCLHRPNGSQVALYVDPVTGIAALMDCLRTADCAAAE